MKKFFVAICFCFCFSAQSLNEEDWRNPYGVGLAKEKDFSNHLGHLFNYLFSDYNQIVKPAKKVEVEMLVAYGSLIDVDEGKGVFEASLTNGIIWNDHRLKWNPNSYNNITEFAYPVNKLWTPDVRIYNALNGPDVGGISGHEDGLTLISHDGTIKFIPQKIVKGAIDTEAGIQENEIFENGEKGNKIVLSLKYGPWVYSSSAVQLKASPSGVEFKSVNPKWKITDAKLKEITEIYPCCPDQPYSEVQLIVKVKRV